jgi:hypothetical protein
VRDCLADSIWSHCSVQYRIYVYKTCTYIRLYLRSLRRLILRSRSRAQETGSRLVQPVAGGSSVQHQIKASCSGPSSVSPILRSICVRCRYSVSRSRNHPGLIDVAQRQWCFLELVDPTLLPAKSLNISVSLTKPATARHPETLYIQVKCSTTTSVTSHLG